MTGPRRLMTLALITIAAALLVGCGLRSESSAHRIQNDDVPFGLLDDTTAPSVPITTATPSRAMEIYLVRSNRLVPAEREADRPSVIRSFESLAAGPTPAEAADGIRTAIPPDSAVPLLRSTGPTVFIELEGLVADVAPAEQTLALAQMVYTATAFSGIESVQFLIGGEPADIPRADGTLTRGRVTRADYQGLG